MASPIVILGASGMLGASWTRLAPAWRPGRDQIRALSHVECNILDPASIRAAIAPGSKTVINCAAYTDVDRAESDEAGATALNAEGVAALADRCAHVGATLVHYSTDYVFNGSATSPYAVDEPRAPINAYGRSKACGEALIEQSRLGGVGDFLVIRTSWLYAPHGKNFVRTIAKLARERASLRVVDDQRGRPTSCEALVTLTQRLLNAQARGFLHACDSGECTWFEFAQAIAESVNPACIVEACSTAEYPRPAKRPSYSVLDLSKTERLIGSAPHWRASLDRVLSTMRASADQPV